MKKNRRRTAKILGIPDGKDRNVHHSEQNKRFKRLLQSKIKGQTHAPVLNYRMLSRGYTKSICC